jgi:uncharacterized protein YodC (DUF2158 family)
MTFEPGEVVTLKSGGQPMTVVSVSENDIDCVWIGEEGEFFHHSIPAVALTSVASDEEHDENHDEEDDDDDDEEDEDESGEKAPKRKRKAA